jgi:hypothetical protein
MPMCPPRPYQSSQQSAASANSIKCHSFLHGVANDILEQDDNTIALPRPRGQSIQEGRCHRIDATLAPANSTAICDPALAGPSIPTSLQLQNTQNASAGNRTRVTSMATMYSTTRPLMPMSSRINAPAMLDQPSHSINLPVPLSLASSDSCPCEPK